MPLDWSRIANQTLKPQFRAAIEELFADCPPHYHFVITHGVRTDAQQNTLYGQGRHPSELIAVGLDPKYANPKLPRVTAARAGQSAHNFGCAIDVALDGDLQKDGVQPDWTPSDGDGWLWLRAQVHKKHPTLKGGWEWGDWPHIEWREWRKVRAAMKPRPA